MLVLGRASLDFHVGDILSLSCNAPHDQFISLRMCMSTFSMGNFCLQSDKPNVVKQMVLNLLGSDSECSDVPLETAITLKFFQPFGTGSLLLFNIDS